MKTVGRRPKAEDSKKQAGNNHSLLAAQRPARVRHRPRRINYLLPSAFGLLLSAFCLLPACSPRSSAFVLALESSPKTLDPLKGFDASSERMRQLMFNTLMRKNEQLDYVPELATPQVTAADCKYTFEQLIYKHAADYTKAASFYEGAVKDNQPYITSIDAPDARTLVFHLRKPWLELYANLIPIPIIPEGTFEQQATHPIGSGPFKFVNWNESQQVVDMEANNDYWQGAPNIKQLRVRVILDANTQQAELRSGRVDLAINTSLSPDAYVALAKDPNLQVTQSPGTNVQWLGFNTQSAPLTDARVRQAIAYAIDRESIVKNLLLGQARVAHSMIPPESWAYAQGQVYTYDPAHAKQLLDEAGLRDPDGDGPRMRLDKPLSFEISGSNVVVRGYAQVIQNQLKEVGLPVSIETLEDNTLREAQVNGQFQLTAGRWVGGNQDPIFLRDLFTHLKGGNFNRSRYDNSELDKILSEAVSTADRARAKQLYAQAQELISREMPALPLWYANNIVIARKSVGNIQVPPGGDWTFVRNLTVAQK